MLTIRFSRIGKRRKPFYRIIISEKQQDTQGHYLELLGHYNPHTKEATLKGDRITHWLGLGAATSDTVFNLLVKHKLITSDQKRRSVTISARRAEKIAQKKKEQEAPTEKPTETPAEIEATPESTEPPATPDAA